MRQNPRHRRPGRPGLYVMGGQVPEPVHEDGRVFAEAAADTAALLAQAELTPEDRVAAAVLWDQTTAAEPYQLDVTRGLEDTVRMGNTLSAAIRLELLADSWREEARDGRTDPVTGDQLDPVDGLPLDGDDDDGNPDLIEAMRQGHRDALTELTVADLQAELAPLRYAMPRPINGDAVGAPVEEEVWQAPPGTPVTAVGLEVGHGGIVLNWRSRHDPKSLEYGVRAKLRAPAPLVDRLWEHGPILDQGTAPPLSLHDASGCTGHAGINAANVLELATVPVYTRPEDVDLFGHDDAMRLYERAQELDDIPGEAYPGTSILALMKAGQELGLWGTYLWAFGTRDIAQAILQVGPVVVGIPWLAGMTDTDADGVVTVTGAQQGGHALCLFALRMKVAGRAGPFFGALQSWGESTGDHGVIWFHHKDLAQLLHGVGEAAIPLTPPTEAAL